MFQKQKRKVDKGLLAAVKEKGCIISGEKPCDPHHVTSIGAGGSDSINNVVGLARKYHQEIHTKGAIYMKNTYPRFHAWLLENERYDILNREDC